MAIETLPSLYPEYDDTSSNLAGGVLFPRPQLTTFLTASDNPQGVAFSGFDVPQAIPTPTAPLYRAYDGTPIGYGSTCDPISDEMQLSGYGEDLIPGVLKDNRITFLEDLAMPLLMGVGKYMQSGSIPQALGWSLGSYMAPYPVAVFLAYKAVVNRRSEDLMRRPYSLPPPPRRLRGGGRREIRRVNLRVR
jgi:hypothetical protein